jgi:hypothetical protein
MIPEEFAGEEVTKEDFIPGTKEHPKEYGIQDTKSGQWMGTSDCPLTFGKYVPAQIHAQAIAEQLKLPMGRFMAKRFTGANVKVGEEEVSCSFEDALSKIMEE